VWLERLSRPCLFVVSNLKASPFSSCRPLTANSGIAGDICPGFSSNDDDDDDGYDDDGYDDDGYDDDLYDDDFYDDDDDAA
jgi:hypothetical protein